MNLKLNIGDIDTSLIKQHTVPILNTNSKIVGKCKIFNPFYAEVLEIEDFYKSYLEKTKDFFQLNLSATLSKDEERKTQLKVTGCYLIPISEPQDTLDWDDVIEDAKKYLKQTQPVTRIIDIEFDMLKNFLSTNYNIKRK